MSSNSGNVTALRERLLRRWDGDPLAPGVSLEPCRNPACQRVVRQGVMYCCGGCDRSHAMKADTGDAGEPMFSHGDGCNQRWNDRLEAMRRA